MVVSVVLVAVTGSIGEGRSLNGLVPYRAAAALPISMVDVVEWCVAG